MTTPIHYISPKQAKTLQNILPKHTSEAFKAVNRSPQKRRRGLLTGLSGLSVAPDHWQCANSLTCVSHSCEPWSPRAWVYFSDFSTFRGKLATHNRLLPLKPDDPHARSSLNLTNQSITNFFGGVLTTHIQYISPKQAKYAIYQHRLEHVVLLAV